MSMPPSRKGASLTFGNILTSCHGQRFPNPKNVDSDLRPISFTPVLSKVLEGFVFTWLCPFVMPTVDPRQSSDIKNSFTIPCLVHLLHHWLSAADAPNTIVRSCLIDFSKAFDRVDHNILITKLCLLGVAPILLDWCASVLQDRQQRVKIVRAKSM